MDSQSHWYQPIRDEFDRSFDDPWDARLAQFNNRPYVKTMKTRFLLPRPGLPPAWFNGNIPALQAGEWVLVVSINPYIDPEELPLYHDDGSPEAWWNHWCTFNQHPANWGKSHFFPEMVQLAAEACGEPLPSDLHDFATNRMLFVEFCPYASQGFKGSDWLRWKEVAARDTGFDTARRIRQLLFDYGQPKLVLCNGKFPTYDVKDQQFGVSNLKRKCIERNDLLGTVLNVYHGHYQPVLGAPFPVVGVTPQISNRMPRLIAMKKTIVDLFQHGDTARNLALWSCPEKL